MQTNGIPCRVWLSGFCPEILESTNRLSISLNNLAQVCRKCRVFATEESARELKLRVCPNHRTLISGVIDPPKASHSKATRALTTHITGLE
jgi:hypothetical protein